MVSPFVRRLLDQLLGDNEGEQHIAVREATKLDETEREALLQLLQQQVERHPDRLTGPAALTLLAENKLKGAAQTLFSSLRNANAKRLAPGIAFRIQELGTADPKLAGDTRSILDNWLQVLGTAELAQIHQRIRHQGVVVSNEAIEELAHAVWHPIGLEPRTGIDVHL